jgi:hypothetical protein
MAAVSYAQEPVIGYPQNGDPWNYVPQPSGMQYASDAGAFYGDGGPGCGCNRCVHWTQVSWYARWPNDGWPPLKHHHCKKCAVCY